MKTKLLQIALLTICCLIQFSAKEREQESTSRVVLKKMVDALQSCKAVKYELRSFEKSLDGNAQQEGHTLTKINIFPTKI